MKQCDYSDRDPCVGENSRCDLTVLLRKEAERREKVRPWLRLYAVTDRGKAAGQEPPEAKSRTHKERTAKRVKTGTRTFEALEEQVRDAIRGGVTCVQLREKSREGDIVSPEELLKEAVRMAGVCHGKEKRTPLIVDDNVEVAVQSGADGVHVGQNDMSVADVRRIVGPDMIIGASAHSVEEAKAAEADGADYLGVGAAFKTETKKDVIPLTREMLCEICSAVSIPVVVIGGITKENAMQLAGSGVAGIAVSSAIFKAEDCRQAAAELKDIADLVVGQD